MIRYAALQCTKCKEFVPLAPFGAPSRCCGAEIIAVKR